ncbi:hypothetical protein [Viridibacillus arvi]
MNSVVQPSVILLTMNYTADAVWLILVVRFLTARLLIMDVNAS